MDRWAVKEAAYKALQPKSTLTWKQLSLEKLDRRSRKPELLIEPKATTQPLHLHCSISHDGAYIVAFVVAEEAASV